MSSQSRSCSRRSMTAAVFRPRSSTMKLIPLMQTSYRNEPTLQPGLAVREAFHDPKDGKVKLDCENIVAFPKLPEFQQVMLEALRWEEREKPLVIKEAEVMA